jgi:hypothetical protein
MQQAKCDANQGMAVTVADDRLFVAIGVSQPKGGLEALPGAITAAERMTAWAKAQGYVTLLIHDPHGEEITTDLLRREITAAIQDITSHTALQRLVIFFAGHGAALAVGDQCWILTNWLQRPTEAIRVSALQRMLEYYGPKQVSMIGDACQEFSSKFIDLLGSAVLDRPDEEQGTYELDQFFAVDVGKQAFMIKAADGQQAFCIFTEVLLDALEGDAQSPCFEQNGADKFVTSQSLASYLDANVEREAAKYGVRMIPRPKPGFYTDRIYLAMPGTPPAQPSGQLTSGAGATPDRSGAASGSAKATKRSVAKIHLTKPPKDLPAFSIKSSALDISREMQRAVFVGEAGQAAVRNHFETRCGICVSGATVADVHASRGRASRMDEDPNWFRIDLGSEPSHNNKWSDVLVALDSGRLVSVCAIEGFVAGLHVFDASALSLFHRELGAPDYHGEFAIDLLAKVYTGLLDPREIIDAATGLRYGKHRVITLGCIAAQFYDAIRDVDSLRSMAAFYAQHRQPVPLDIILFGGGTIREVNGCLCASIPAVPARAPRTDGERRQSFTYEATPAIEGHPIAGRIPWMRQAWSALATAQCDESASHWHQRALAAVEFLAPGAFTVALPEGRDAFFALAGITEEQDKFEPPISVYAVP